mgnify:CR=1 FL=1
MTRPDPAQIARRPMAAARNVITARSSADGQSGALFDRLGRLNIDCLHRLVDQAESVVEGCAYGDGAGETFLGTVLLSVQLGSEAQADRLAGALRGDARARRAVSDRVFREMARLLEAQTPAQFTSDCTVRAEGALIQVAVDIEAPLGARSVAAG